MILIYILSQFKLAGKYYILKFPENIGARLLFILSNVIASQLKVYAYYYKTNHLCVFCNFLIYLILLIKLFCTWYVKINSRYYSVFKIEFCVFSNLPMFQRMSWSVWTHNGPISAFSMLGITSVDIWKYIMSIIKNFVLSRNSFSLQLKYYMSSSFIWEFFSLFRSLAISWIYI